jgi:hypothetical protein
MAGTAKKPRSDEQEQPARVGLSLAAIMHYECHTSSVVSASGACLSNPNRPMKTLMLPVDHELVDLF